MKATLCFTALELIILLLQAAAVGAILSLIAISGADTPRVLIGAATLALILAKVAGSVRRGKSTEISASGVSRTES